MAEVAEVVEEVGEVEGEEAEAGALAGGCLFAGMSVKDDRSVVKTIVKYLPGGGGGGGGEAGGRQAEGGRAVHHISQSLMSASRHYKRTYQVETGARARARRWARRLSQTVRQRLITTCRDRAEVLTRGRGTGHLAGSGLLERRKDSSRRD